MAEGEVRIEDVHGPEALREIEDLQLAVWGGDAREIVPAHMLHMARESGGILLAARVGDEAVGFAFGILGQDERGPFHASHMLGIHQGWQGRGIGEALKRAQRERALAQGLGRMTWTFDPLQARNAHFNLHKLGASTRMYVVNFYGEMQDDINRGMPSDRLIVEWDLRRGAVDHPSADGAETMLRDRESRPEAAAGPWPSAPALRVELPPSIDRLKREQGLDRALRWRLAVREILRRAFAEGYVARDFRDGAYVLTREE